MVSWLTSVLRLSGFLTGDGDWKLKSIQRDLLDAFLAGVDPALRSSVERQVAQPFYMQFWNGGRINPFFFDPLELPPELLIPGPDFVDCLYKVELFVDGRKQHAQVTFYKGRIFSLQFRNPLKFYKGKTVHFGAVTKGSSKQSVARLLDRFEHDDEASE